MAAAYHPVVAQVEAEDIRVEAIPVVDTQVEVTPAAVIPVEVTPVVAIRGVAGPTGARMPAVVTPRLTRSSSN